MHFKLTLFAMAGSALMGAASAEDTCRTVWGHKVHDASEEPNFCTEHIGADYWGWTSGRYGLSGCDSCDCPDCPTSPPTPSDPPTKAPTPSPVPLPPKCSGITGSWSGDPHFHTFDGLKYDCQGEGEFHVLKSLDSDFEIQSRFAKMNSKSRPTVTTSVVWNTADEGDPIIQVSAPKKPIDDDTDYCRPSVYLDGVLVESPLASEFIHPQVQIGDYENKKSRGYYFYHHQSGFNIEVVAKPAANQAKSDQQGCILMVKICVPEDWERYKETFVGLLGTPDGDTSNDWMDRDNKPVEVPTAKADLKFDKSYEWCTTWCVASEPESLFSYGAGESYDSLNNCDQETDTETKDCVLNPAADLSAVCGTEDYACLVDGCTGGADEAKDYVEVQALLLDTSCGKEVYFEDWHDGDGGWNHDVETATNDVSIGTFMYLSVPSREMSDSASKTIQVPSGADMIEISFTLVELGGWETELYPESFFVHINDPEYKNGIDLGDFAEGPTEDNPSEEFSNIAQGVYWSRYAITAWLGTFGTSISKQYDQLHRVTLKIPSSYYENGEITLGFTFKQQGQKVDEAAGIDDLRIVAYGEGCDIPGEDGIKEEESCGEQVLAENFKGTYAYEWGNVVTPEVGGPSYLQLDSWSSQTVFLDDIEIQSAARTASIEFYVYGIGDWTQCPKQTKGTGNQMKEKTSCGTLKLGFLGSLGGTKEHDVDLFEYGTLARDEYVDAKLNWSREVVVEGQLERITVSIPSEYWSKGILNFKLGYAKTVSQDIAIGISDLRVTTFSDACKALEVGARRRLKAFMETHKLQAVYDHGRRLLEVSDGQPCQCVCPILPDDNGSTELTTMKLHYSRDPITCEPEQDPVGTVVMTPLVDGTVKFEYSIDQGYTLESVSFYVGKDKLPYDSLGKALGPQEFPYVFDGNDVAEFEASFDHSINPEVCDYYAAVSAVVCGDFPPTEAPTSPPTDSPTPDITLPPTPGYTMPPTTPDVTMPPTTPDVTMPPTTPDVTLPPTTPDVTLPPTSSPTRPPHPIGSASGDPHVLTWGGEMFDFHGACDLVLVDSPNFDDGKGLKIHIRTKIVTWWSYIDQAVVKLGDDTFEIQGGKKEWNYWINGNHGNHTETGLLESKIGGYDIMFNDISKKQKRFRLMELPAGLAISFETFGDFIRVNVRADTKKHFLGSLGLMGTYPEGNKVARDGKTVMEDTDAFGKEWQVRANEEKLFHNVEGVQAPETCRMPTMAEEESRRLGEASIDMEDAKKACEHVRNTQDFDACVFDILATNDKEMAGAY